MPAKKIMDPGNDALRNLFKQILQSIQSGICCIDIELALKWNTNDYPSDSIAKKTVQASTLSLTDIAQACDEDENTLLHHFSSSYLDPQAVEDFKILVEKLLAVGANINSKNKYGFTCLDNAVNHSPSYLNTTTRVTKDAVLQCRKSNAAAMIKILKELGAKTSEELELLIDPDSMEAMQQISGAEAIEKNSAAFINIPKLGCR